MDFDIHTKTSAKAISNTNEENDVTVSKDGNLSIRDILKCHDTPCSSANGKLNALSFEDTSERNLLKSSEEEKSSFSFRSTGKPAEVEAPVINQYEKVCSALESDTQSEITNGLEDEVESQLVNILENHILTSDSVAEQKSETNSTEPTRNITSLRKRKLLVLDINGLLADIFIDIHHVHGGRKKVGGKVVFKRPFCEDFMKFCFERFAVGIWSSRKKYNVDSVIDYILGENRQKFLFCWDQDHCTDTGFRTLENVHKPLVLKELKKLWNKEEKGLPWEKGDFSPSNTLLIDDSPYKALANPAFTAIFPDPYQHENENDISLGRGGDLRVYLEGLYKANDIQLYVQKHPFGQQPITSKDSSWSFYSQVINSHNDISVKFINSNLRNNYQEKDQDSKNHTQRNNFSTYRGNANNNHRGRDRYENQGNRPRCQICAKFGHTAARCYFRYNKDSESSQTYNMNNRNQSMNANLAHLHQDSRNQQISTDEENETTKEDTIQDEAWNSDSGTTNHVTSKLQNLNLSCKEYTG